MLVTGPIEPRLLLAFDTETTGLNPWRSEVYRRHGMEPS
jgi:hypothetical protein